ncbi:hypothetical protein PM082_004314 [Marasmius tenuissimus]|nr:hypothetical protein PM082_004314 [Marasmius tenuissimus]
MDFFRKSSGFGIKHGSFNAVQGNVFHNTYNSSEHTPSAHNTTNYGEIHNHFHYHIMGRENRIAETSSSFGKEDVGHRSASHLTEETIHPCTLCKNQFDSLRERELVMEYESALRHLMKARNEWMWRSRAI